MATVNIDDAKTRLSQRVDGAAGGEDVVVSRNGKPLVRITQLIEPKRLIKFGMLKGKLRIAPDFDAPLQDDTVADPDALAAAIEASGFTELPVRVLHSAGVARLAPHHNDRFDRLLIGQAIAEPLTFLTADALLVRHSDPVRLV